MQWPQSESEFTRVMKELLNDVFIPAAMESIRNEMYKDIDKIVEHAVKRKYQEQVVATNEELAKSLTRVIELLARRQSEFTQLSEGL